MKALIQVKRNLWGKVKEYATIKDLTIYSAVEQLLLQALIANGYFIRKGDGDERRIILDFISRCCKQGQHANCEITWYGFGYEVLCRCDCHGRDLIVQQRK